MADIQEIIGKALSDKDFCASLIEDPGKVFKEFGIEPTSEMLDALEGLDTNAVQKLAAAFGKEQAA